MRLVTHCPDGDIVTPFGAVDINFCDLLLGETLERRTDASRRRKDMLDYAS
jgi:hypothetical protein